MVMILENIVLRDKPPNSREFNWGLFKLLYIAYVLFAPYSSSLYRKRNKTKILCSSLEINSLIHIVFSVLDFTKSSFLISHSYVQDVDQKR